MSVRFIIIYGSMLCMLVSVSIFISGPFWGLGLDYQKGEHVHLLQIIAPVFISYLSAAVVYATSSKKIREPRGEKGRILRVISIFSISLFLVGLFLSTVLFYYSSLGRLQGVALSFSQYTNIITLLLSLLAGTTTTVVTFIFGTGANESES